MTEDQNQTIRNLTSYLYQQEPIFILKDAADAVFVFAAGGLAISADDGKLNGDIIQAVKTEKIRPALIIAISGEDREESQADQLAISLRKTGAMVFHADLRGRFASIVERSDKDSEGLRAAIADAILATDPEVIARRSAEEYRQKYSAAAYMDEFNLRLADMKNHPPISTGFRELDQAMDGGLTSGLYVIGAISSAGKTTYTLQIADAIAAGGHDVLFISLEQSRFELAAKSISRRTFTIGNQQLGKTTRGIMDASRYAGYRVEEMRVMLDAIEEFKAQGERMFIMEGTGQMDVMGIRKAVERHLQHRGAAPVVFVDYLQILKPDNDRATDKMNTDRAVSELKRISRDFNTPVIAISSFNRASYSDKVDMGSFKESGAIEYSSDCLIGLQMKNAGNKGIDLAAEKLKDPREVEVTIIKQRNGLPSVTIDTYFTARFNSFQECGTQGRRYGT